MGIWKEVDVPPNLQPAEPNLRLVLSSRICPGRHFASMTLWHAVAYTLATLEIVPKTDEMGNAILPEVEFTEGLVW